MAELEIVKAGFNNRSRKNSCGVIGFYWEMPPEELRRSKKIEHALMLGWLDDFVGMTKPPGIPPR
jgi:hypothetical protein